ncbi:phosphatidate cytidylyltransferase [Puteibacter caeruleilacunae]|nr:phosphatidate cytidylyltransferase [Puteibacter caeruleilacunae]
MSNFLTRTITGILFVAILMIGIVYSSWSFFVLFLVIQFFSLREFYTLSEKAKIFPNYTLGLAAGAYLFVTLYFGLLGVSSMKYTLGIIPLGLLIFICELFRKKEKPIENIAYTIMGIVLIALPIALFNFFVFPSYIAGEYFPYILFGIFIIQWANDSGAYVIGVSFGKHRLFERISPKKSWEGAVGGVLSALLAAFLLSLLVKELSLIHWLVIGAIISVFGTFGDLVESLYKRTLGVKDSGSILPGHGGMLDRFDSIVFAAPAVFVYLYLTFA